MTRAWVVLIGGALLFAGCAPAADSDPSTSPSSEPSSSATGMDCPLGASPDRPGDPTQARPALREWHQLAAMDPTGPRIIVGESEFVPEGAGIATLQSSWAFDVCTNTWSELGDDSLPAPEQRPGMQQFVTDPGAGVVRGIPVSWTPVWDFRPADDSWSAPPAGSRGSEAVPKVVHDPSEDRLLGFDPHLLAAGDGSTGVLSYDPSARTWTSLAVPDPQSPGPRVQMDAYDVAYDPAAQQLILLVTPEGSDGRASTWRFDPAARAWSRGADVPDTLAGGYPTSGWAAAFDPATGRTWWFADTAMLGYDARSDAWVVAERSAGWPAPTVLGQAQVDPTARIVSTMVFDPVNGRLVVIGGRVRPVGDPVGGFVGPTSMRPTDDVWAYQPATNTWTRLLAASAAPASYGPG